MEDALRLGRQLAVAEEERRAWRVRLGALRGDDVLAAGDVQLGECASVVAFLQTGLGDCARLQHELLRRDVQLPRDQSL